jgi:phage gp16-like protein
MIVNASAYRAILRQFEAEQRRLLRLRKKLTEMELEPAEIERVLEPLRKSCQDLALEVRRCQPMSRGRRNP